MKYVKLFESWVQSMNEAKVEIPKEFEIKPQENYPKGWGFKSGAPVDTKLGNGIQFNSHLELLDAENPSNNNLSSGITIYGSLIKYPSEKGGTSAGGTGRWTISPITFMNLLTKNKEATALKKKIENEIKSINEKYNMPFMNDYRQVYYDGKIFSYKDNENQYAGADIKKKLSKEQIDSLRESVKNTYNAVKELLADVEKEGAPLLEQEIKAGGPLKTGMKLLSAYPKDMSGSTTSADAGMIVRWLKALETDINDKNKFDAKCTVINISLGALAYVHAKCLLIEAAAEDPKIALSIAGAYGNTNNKFAADISKNWNSIKDIVKGLGGKESEMDKYAPKSPKPAPEK